MYFRLEEAERIGAGGETSCPCNRVAVLEQLRLNQPEVNVYASVGSPYVDAPPLVDLTEETKRPRAKVRKRRRRRRRTDEYLQPKIFRDEEYAPEDLPFFMRPGSFWPTKYPEPDTDDDDDDERHKRVWYHIPEEEEEEKKETPQSESPKKSVK